MGTGGCRCKASSSAMQNAVLRSIPVESVQSLTHSEVSNVQESGSAVLQVVAMVMVAHKAAAERSKHQHGAKRLLQRLLLGHVLRPAAG